MARTFTWRPRLETPVEVSFAFFEAKFGDGYKQKVGQGLNNESETWDLEFTGKKEEIFAIRQFLREHNGVIPFEWTPRGETEPKLFDCSQYSAVNLSQVQAGGTDVWTLSARFEQRFGV